MRKTAIALLLLLAASAGAQEGQVLNVNTASEKQLELLWRTGPVTAKAIVEGRPYETLSQLQGVKGIGSRWAVVNGPYLVLDGETTLNVKIKIPARKVEKPNA